MVPNSGRGLYQVSHESDTANLATDVLTLDQLHCRMGHISPETARRLVEVARHVVWLMNHTLTRAVNGETPYEAAFGKKPDLHHVCEWGEKVWVSTETGDKLGGHITEGHWLGIDKRSKGFHIYWPYKQTVSVEHNVHLDNRNSSGSRLEGEDWQIIKMKSDVPPIAPNTAVAPTPSQSAPVADPQITSTDTANPTHLNLKPKHPPNECISQVITSVTSWTDTAPLLTVHLILLLLLEFNSLPLQIMMWFLRGRGQPTG
jgi:hypothetical protein